jgi:flagellar biosynthesis chaperone FliJ
MRLVDLMSCESLLQHELLKEREKTEKIECDFRLKTDEFAEFMETSRVHTFSIQKEIADKLQRELNNRQSEIEAVHQNYGQIIHDLKEKALEDKKIHDQRLDDHERKYEDRIRMITDERNQIEYNFQNSQSQVTSLEQIKEKQIATITTLDSQYNNILNEASNLRIDLEDHKVKLKGLSSQVECLGKDKKKLQYIVRRYHNDRIEIKRRLKEQYDIIRVHEEASVSKDIEVSGIHARMEEMEGTIEKLKNELSDKLQLIEQLKISIADQSKTLDSNQQVIHWLNKEISMIQKDSLGQKSVIDSGDDWRHNFLRINSAGRPSSSLSLPVLYGPRSCVPTHFSPCIENSTPTKTSMALPISSGSSPNTNRQFHNITHVLPEPQPYTPRDRNVS